MDYFRITTILFNKSNAILLIACIIGGVSVYPGQCFEETNYGQEGLEQALDGKFEAALKSFNMEISTQPNDPQVYVNRGGIYEQLGRRDQAIHDETLAIKMMSKKSFPDKQLAAMAYSNRGSLYSLTGKSAKAISDLEKAIAMYPTYPGAHNYLGRVYLKQGKKDAAIEQWKLAVQYYRHEQGTKEAAELEEKIRALEAPH